MGHASSAAFVIGMPLQSCAKFWLLLRDGLKSTSPLLRLNCAQMVNFLFHNTDAAHSPFAWSFLMKPLFQWYQAPEYLHHYKDKRVEADSIVFHTFGTGMACLMTLEDWNTMEKLVKNDYIMDSVIEAVLRPITPESLAVSFGACKSLCIMIMRSVIPRIDSSAHSHWVQRVLAVMSRRPTLIPELAAQLWTITSETMWNEIQERIHLPRIANTSPLSEAAHCFCNLYCLILEMIHSVSYLKEYHHCFYAQVAGSKPPRSALQVVADVAAWASRLPNPFSTPFCSPWQSAVHSILTDSGYGHLITQRGLEYSYYTILPIEQSYFCIQVHMGLISKPQPIFREVEDMKRRGSHHYRRRHFADAVSYYSSAISLLEMAQLQKKKAAEEALSLYCLRSMAWHGSHLPDHALRDAETALKIDPKSPLAQRCRKGALELKSQPLPTSRVVVSDVGELAMRPLRRWIGPSWVGVSLRKASSTRDDLEHPQSYRDQTIVGDQISHSSSSSSSACIVDGPKSSEQKESECVDNDRMTCPVCLDDRANHALDPCGHLFCSACVSKLNACAICRSAFQTSIKLFL
eukprot:TRINITY_DN3843_c0_g1_i1.p1 TRINITY_DN3843_c0_g1~~TRINITY_DN3843_c0_g1_i1.p1  ORF type:complete len:575 (+),score=55.84 TRINITY_DN3843_c0_g1_i1:610-2334(+)